MSSANMRFFIGLNLGRKSKARGKCAAKGRRFAPVSYVGAEAPTPQKNQAIEPQYSKLLVERFRIFGVREFEFGGFGLVVGRGAF